MAVENYFGLKQAAIVLAIASVFIGCDRGPKCYPISGTVTWNGQSVPMGSITFLPAEGGRPATGKLAADGTYSLSTFEMGDGAQAGEYTVLLECVEYPPTGEVIPQTFAEELAGDTAVAGRVKPPIWHVPEEYSAPDTSKLKISVTERATIDFALPIAE